GGMSSVYLGIAHRNEPRVALKVLRPELAQSLGPERFLREIKVAAGLTHPHILPLFDSGVAGGLLFYTMPYVGGGDAAPPLDPPAAPAGRRRRDDHARRRRCAVL